MPGSSSPSSATSGCTAPWSGRCAASARTARRPRSRSGCGPTSAKSIPENVKVEILPTTLFGQKYVALVDPADPSSKALSDGDVIPSDRVTTNVELSTILANLFPLLRSIRPADLSATLYAIANALRGKGDEIGADPGQARLLPHRHQRPPADAAAGPRAAGPGEQDLLARRAGPDPAAPQRHHHRAHGRLEGDPAARLLRGRDRPGQDLDPRPDGPTSRPSSARRRWPARC